MSEKNQQTNSNLRGTNARTLVLKVSPLSLDENHSLVKLVRQPLSKINLLEELKDDDVVNNINKLKQFQSALLAALLEDIQQEVRYITVPALILSLFKNSVRNVVRNMIVIQDYIYSQIMKKVMEDINDVEKLLNDMKLLQHYIDIVNSFYLAIDNIAVVVINLLNMNLPADRAPRIINEVLTGYDIWKQH